MLWMARSRSDEQQMARAAMLISSADSFSPRARQLRTRSAPSCPQPCAIAKRLTRCRCRC